MSQPKCDTDLPRTPQHPDLVILLSEEVVYRSSQEGNNLSAFAEIYRVFFLSPGRNFQFGSHS